MWIARIKINGEQGLIGSRTKKHNVSIAAYPLAIKKEKNYILVDLCAFVFGEDSDKKNFLIDLKKCRDIINLEINGDFIVLQAKDRKEFEAAYPSNILNLEPILIDKKGDNFYTVGSWNRIGLNKFLKFLSKSQKTEILEITERKISSFSLAKLRPELTDKQKKAMELAIKKGYYNYPRKISVEKLAKISKVSFSAFHAHLRKAEQKILPFFFEN